MMLHDNGIIWFCALLLSTGCSVSQRKTPQRRQQLNIVRDQFYSDSKTYADEIAAIKEQLSKLQDCDCAVRPSETSSSAIQVPVVPPTADNTSSNTSSDFETQCTSFLLNGFKNLKQFCKSQIHKNSTAVQDLTRQLAHIKTDLLKKVNSVQHDIQVMFQDLADRFAERTAFLDIRLQSAQTQREQDDERIMDEIRALERVGEEETLNLQGQIDSLLTASSNFEQDNWQLVFRCTAGTGTDVYKAWLRGKDITTQKPTSMYYDPITNAQNYRSNKIDNWREGSITKVKVALYKNGQQVAYIVFRGNGSTARNWFSQDRVLESSWFDLQAKKFNYFSIRGHPLVERRFFVNLNYGGCPNDKGYMVVINSYKPQNRRFTCSWDTQATYPQFLYSQIPTEDFYAYHMYGRAEFLAVFVQTE